MPTNQTASLGSSNALRDIRPPVEIPSGWEWVWWTLGALAALGFFVWLIRYLRNRSKEVPAPPPIPAHVRARRKLEEALSLIAEPKPFCTLVSDTIRFYLEERFDFRAPERTTEEFLRELSRSNLLTREQKESLGGFLQSCDLVKFAKYEPTETELRELHDSALRLVDETEPPPLETSAVAEPIVTNE